MLSVRHIRKLEERFRNISRNLADMDIQEFWFSDMVSPCSFDGRQEMEQEFSDVCNLLLDVWERRPGKISEDIAEIFSQVEEAVKAGRNE